MGNSQGDRDRGVRWRLEILLLGVALVAGVSSAGDAWKTKLPEQWTERESLEIITDSPWAQRVAPLGQLSLDYNPSGAPRGTREGLTEIEGGAQHPEGPGSSSPSSGTPSFLVQWASATTFRQALARLQQLRGAVTAEQAAQFLQRVPANYELVISGPGVAAFEGRSEDWMREKFRLQLKPGKTKLTPVGVQLLRAPSSERLQVITLLFARQDTTGQDSIPPRSEKAELNCKLESSELSATFDLRKMVVQGQPDR